MPFFRKSPVFFIFALFSGAMAWGGTNPDGRAWSPAPGFSALFAPSRLIQRATLIQPPYPNADVDFNADQSIVWNGWLTLPLNDFLSLQGSYASSDMAFHALYVVQGNRFSENISNRQSLRGLGLKIFSQGFVNGGPPDWDHGYGPDGRFWFPALSLAWDQDGIASKDEQSFANSPQIYKTLESSFSYQRVFSEISIPMPQYWAGIGIYGREIRRSYSNQDDPSRSFEDGGDFSQWSAGVTKIMNMEDSGEGRAWNPDGKAGSVKLAARYGESYASARRASQNFEASLVCPANSWLSIQVSFNLNVAQSDPFESAPGQTVRNDQTHRGQLSAGLGFQFYLPDTLARPFSVSEKPKDSPLPTAPPHAPNAAGPHFEGSRELPQIGQETKSGASK